MAGSLNHIVGENGEFTPGMIENMGDAYELMGEAHQFLAILANRWGGDSIVADILEEAGYPKLRAMPKIDGRMQGVKSKWSATRP